MTINVQFTAGELLWVLSEGGGHVDFDARKMFGRYYINVSCKVFGCVTVVNIVLLVELVCHCINWLLMTQRVVSEIL